MERLDRRQRLVLYGLCGFAAEVIFTSTWAAIESGNRKMHGLTSTYAFFIYGISGLVQEALYLILKERMGLLLRGVIYLLWSLSWECSTGLFLKHFDACPWDYASYFRGHFMGVITAEYIPLWYFTCIASERFLIRNALLLCWRPNVLLKQID